MTTMVDLIRRSGREPGGGYPKGYSETWTISWGKQKKHGPRHAWLPYEPITMTGIAQHFDFNTPEIVDALHEPNRIFRVRGLKWPRPRP